MNLISIVKSMFGRKMTFEELRSSVSNHMQDSEVLHGKQQIDEFWQGKIDEFNAFLESHPGYQRLQELKQALKYQGEVKSSYEVELRNEVEDVRDKLCDDLSVMGIFLMDDNQHIDRSKYLDLSFYPPFGGEVLGEAIRASGIPNLYFFRKRPYIESKTCEQVTSTASSLYRKQSDQLTKVVMSYLGNHFKAIYLCPAWAPSEVEMRRRGEWVYLDKINLPADGSVDHFYKTNPRIRFVQHDLTNPDLPLSESSFDFIYYNVDFAGGGVTHKAAEKLVKPKGIIMTLKGSNPTDNTNLHKLGSYEFYGYQLLTKMAK